MPSQSIPLADLAELQKDKARLDWLADPANKIGNVQLPSSAVTANPHSLRAAIDAAMSCDYSPRAALIKQGYLKP